MTSRYSEDIRRIVGVKDTKGGLDSQENRDPLNATRGIGYINTSGGTSSVSGGSKAVRPAQPQLVGGQTSALSGTNPDEALAGDGAAETAADGSPANTAAADKLLDRSDITSNVQQLTDAFGNPINNKRIINEITGVDCTTGDAVSISLVDDWAPPDATYFPDGSLKSNEWDNASTPPIVATYRDGTYWTVLGAGPGGIIEGADPSSVSQAALARINATQPGDWSISTFEPTPADPVIEYGLVIERVVGGVVTGQFNLLINAANCVGTPPVDGAACPVSPPYETQWPNDGPVKYKKNDRGTFSTSPYDPNAPLGTNDGGSSVNMCGSTSGDFIKVLAGANGNTLVYQTDVANGPMTAGTLAVIMGPDNTVAGYTDSQGLSSYTLK